MLLPELGLIEDIARTEVLNTVFDMTKYYRLLKDGNALQSLTDIDLEHTKNSGQYAFRANCITMAYELTQTLKRNSELKTMGINSYVVGLDAQHLTDSQRKEFPYGHSAVIVTRDEIPFLFMDPAYGILKPVELDREVSDTRNFWNGWEFRIGENEGQYMLIGVKGKKTALWNFDPKNRLDENAQEIMQKFAIKRIQRRIYTYGFSEDPPGKGMEAEIGNGSVTWMYSDGSEVTLNINEDDTNYVDAWKKFVDQINELLSKRNLSLDPGYMNDVQIAIDYLKINYENII
jgi:hypothetical protein